MYRFQMKLDKEVDDTHLLIKCEDNEYLSMVMFPEKLYDKLSDLLIEEDVDYFWELKTTPLNRDQFYVMRDLLFKPYGKRVTLTGTEWVFWLLGAIPPQLLPYLKAIKDGSGRKIDFAK